MDKQGDRFWHEEHSEYCWLEKIMADGRYLVCLKPGRHKNDDYYLYDKKELTPAPYKKKY